MAFWKRKREPDEVPAEVRSAGSHFYSTMQRLGDRHPETVRAALALGRAFGRHRDCADAATANSNWKCHGNTGDVDRSDRVQVLNNKIGPNVSAEHIDVKEGTQGGVIRGNTFNGTGISGTNSADSWVDVKGTGYLIEGNTGAFASPGTFKNGYETPNPSTTPSFLNGCGNVWRSNKSDLGNVGEYGVYIPSTSKCKENPNVVHASNTVTKAKKGLTNIPVTP